MLKAYLTYSIHNIPEIKIDTLYENEAKDWADNLLKCGKKVYVGKYDIDTAKWKWFRYYGQNKTLDNKAFTQPPL
jgi:hypothetical protein